MNVGVLQVNITWRWANR